MACACGLRTAFHHHGVRAVSLPHQPSGLCPSSVPPLETPDVGPVPADFSPERQTAGLRQRAAESDRHLSLCDTRVSFLCVFHGLQRPFVLNNCIVVFVERSAAGQSSASGVQGLRGHSPQPLGTVGAAALGEEGWGRGRLLPASAVPLCRRADPAGNTRAHLIGQSRASWPPRVQRGEVRPDPFHTRGLTPPAFANRRGLFAEKCVSACELVSVFACVSNGCWVGH